MGHASTLDIIAGVWVVCTIACNCLHDTTTYRLSMSRLNSVLLCLALQFLVFSLYFLSLFPTHYLCCFSLYVIAVSSTTCSLLNHSSICNKSNRMFVQSSSLDVITMSRIQVYLIAALLIIACVTAFRSPVQAGRLAARAVTGKESNFIVYLIV